MFVRKSRRVCPILSDCRPSLSGEGPVGLFGRQRSNLSRAPAFRSPAFEVVGGFRFSEFPVVLNSFDELYICWSFVFVLVSVTNCNFSQVL